MPTFAKGSAITVSVRAKVTAKMGDPARNGLVGFAYFIFIGEVANQ